MAGDTKCPRTDASPLQALGAEAALCRRERWKVVGREGDKVGVSLEVSSLFEVLCLLSPNTEEGIILHFSRWLLLP